MTDRETPPHLDIEKNPIFQMASIVFKLEQDLRNLKLRKLNLTYFNFRVLQYLIEHDGKQIGEIARATSIRPSVLSRILTQMEQDGLVRRQSDFEDSRRICVYLTDEGTQRYYLAWPTAHKLIKDAVEVLSEEEFNNFNLYLSKISNHISDN